MLKNQNKKFNDKILKVCYFGTYDNFSRNRVFLEGLRQNDIKVIECKDSSRIWFRLFKLTFKYIISESSDIIIVCASNHINLLLARFISLFSRKKIIFDAFVSVYDTYVNDRKLVNENSFKAKFYFYLDKISCLLADVVVLDTIEHAKYFSNQFNIDSDKIKIIYVGSDDKIFSSQNNNHLIKSPSFSEKKFLVHFHGSFIPLQGIHFIVKAAKILENENILFRIIGKGQTHDETITLAKDLKIKNIDFIDCVRYSDLPNYINESDLCLGIFGDTEKSKRVIPNKVYECIAMKKPVLTGNSLAIKEVFTDKENIMLCKMADPEDLAHSIKFLRDDEKLRRKIADNGYVIFKNNFTPKKIGKVIKNIITGIK